ncbi:uncharacterized protein ARB_01312 [Trichophyton benhamiae CBS 112371]|uniref:Spindle pole body component n=1 Tax=Arthroderma benhamiae (strain ATCC MYA-4681 / CBS 112371) TaxID=663331 RepID=D4AYP3_ARTBC|nr:uncharacterized protein ARB_01312 [Trichophyton benhamiae CBS 112371]EFE31713.1 hypothetical protein ARB_01312 [Trichophyton benhamiae CBS 112371]
MNSPSSAKPRVAQERAASYSNPLSRPGVPSARAHGRATSRQESPFSRETTPVAEGRPTIKSINKSHVTSSEVRTERTSVVTREKMQSKQRSAKENIAPGSPRDWDKSRMNRDQHRSNSIAMVTEKPQVDDAQESAILQDLLFVFMGYEGQYIHYANAYNPSMETDRLVGPSFQITPGLDPSLRDLTIAMLKMATHYSAMEAFVEVQSRSEFGAVNHALCAAIRKLLKDYLIMVAQLETQYINNPNFTLHVMHLHTMPTSQTLAQLYSLGQELLKKNSLLAQDPDESIDDFDDVDNILEQLREGGELAPGSMSKKLCKGGNVLGLISQRLATFSGDPATGVLLQTLLREASRPYMAMLNEWLHHGGIRDPHAEFLVKEQKGIKRDKLEEDYTDEYWEKRYTIRDHEVPPQLDAVRDKVLLAGKYLNVVRECGGVDISKEVKDVPKTFDDPRFLDNINGAYAHANASLLHLLLTKNSLTTRFRSLKHYFFLDRSDFFSYFLELGASELRKPAKHVNEGKLQSLLDIVLRQPGSIAAQDPFKEDVKVRMNQMGLTKWLMRVVSVSGIDQDNPEGGMEKYQTPAPQSSDNEKDIIGFDALELDYLVPFPLSLVISRKTVLRYQLVFRHLLSLRHLETLLVNSWQEHSKSTSWKHKSSDRKVELWKRRAWTLRAKMLVFVQQLLYFCTVEVMEPNWQILMNRVNGDGTEATEVTVNGTKQVNRTVDELMQDHVDFLDTCLKECMLTQGKLLKVTSQAPTA